PVTERVAAAAAIAQSEIKKAIRAECQLPGVVIVKWLILNQHNSFARRIGDIRIRRDLILRDDRLKLFVHRAGVVQEKSSIARVPRMERQSEQSRFTAESDFALDIEEVLRKHRTALDDLDS